MGNLFVIALSLGQLKRFKIMKRTFLVFALITIASWGFAQDQDSLGIEESQLIDEPNEIDEEEITQEDYQGLGEPVFSTDEGEEEKVEERQAPKIIYYESTEAPQDRRHKPGRHSDIKTLAGSMNHSGGFGAISFRYSDFRDKTIVMAGLRGGWIVNRTLGIGFEGHGIIPTAKYDDIDDSRDVVLVGGYGGMFIELILFSNQVIHVTFPVSGGAGWLGYTEHWENDFTNPPYTAYDSTGLLRRDPLIDDDTFWYVEPGANIEVNVSRNFRMCFGVSKRFTQDLALISSESSAFDKMNFFMTLKFGRF